MHTLCNVSYSVGLRPLDRRTWGSCGLLSKWPPRWWGRCRIKCHLLPRYSALLDSNIWIYQNVELSYILSHVIAEFLRIAIFVPQIPILMKATSDDEFPTQGIMYQEINSILGYGEHCLIFFCITFLNIHISEEVELCFVTRMTTLRAGQFLPRNCKF